MKTIIAALMTTTILTAACQKDEETATGSSIPITLAADVQGLATRAGGTGAIDNATLANNAYGFGVFAYNGSNAVFSNAKVSYEGSFTTSDISDLNDLHVHPSNWTYGDEKVWPENVTYDFFAYAPFVGTSGSNFSNGSTPGITEVTGSSDGPTIDYTVSETPANAVDLLWGMKGNIGLPWLNQTRNSNGGLVIFAFHHACAALGFHVQAMLDKDNNLTDLTDEGDKSGLLGTDCKITLKSITMTPAIRSFYQSGTLNLNNGTAYTPQWSNKAGEIASLSVSDNIADNLKDQGDMAPSSMTNTGITAAANSQLVIAQSGSNEQMFFLIPDAAQNYTLTVEYYITYKTGESTYKRLAFTNESGALGAGTATITGLELKADTKYYINMVIGLKTFSLDVTASDWADTSVNIGELIENGTSANSSLARQGSRQQP